MNIYETTGAKLRAKHVRTLEVLQKTLDDNNKLRDQLRTLNQGSIKLGSGDAMSKKVCDLETSIVELKQLHQNQMSENQSSHELVRDKWMQKIQQLESDVSTKDTKIQMLNAENNRLKKRCQIAEQKITSTESFGTKQTVELQDKINSLEKQMTQLQTEYELLQSEKEEYKSTASEKKIAQDALIQMRYRAIDLQQQLESKSVEIKQLQLQFQEKQTIQEAKIHELEAAMADKTKQHRYELSALRKQIQKQEESIQAIPMDNSKQYKELNRKLQDEIAALKIALDLQKESELPSLKNKSLFASHIDLKRENHSLRHQIEEMKEVQKRYLGNINKKSVTFPSTRNNKFR